MLKATVFNKYNTAFLKPQNHPWQITNFNKFGKSCFWRSTDTSADIWVLPIYQYRPKWPILLASVGVDKTLLYSSRIQTICTRKHNEASQDNYLKVTLAGAVSQTNKIKHGACVGCRNWNNSIIGMVCNAWIYRMQVLCTNKLPLYFWKFSQHETFDCNLKVHKSNLCPV